MAGAALKAQLREVTGLKGGTAIERASVASDLEHRPAAVDDQGLELEELGFGSAAAMILVAVVCVLLAALPAAVALRAPALPMEWVAAGLGGFVGIIFSLKLAAGACGVAAHLWSVYPAPVVSDTA